MCTSMNGFYEVFVCLFVSSSVNEKGRMVEEKENGIDPKNFKFPFRSDFLWL